MVFAFYDDIHNCGFFREFRHQYGVDDVNHTVICLQISNCDLCIIDEDPLSGNADRDVAALERFNHLTVT